MKKKLISTDEQTDERESFGIKETNLDIVTAIKEELDDDTAALAFIAPYIPARISPRARIMATIGLPEELGIEESIINIKKNPEITKLFLLLNSFGGGVTSSFKVARVIRNSFKEIKVFVPHIAASGGTVIALVGNQIVMGEMSHLTPIDVQTERNGRMYSVNSMIRSFGNLNEMFEKTTEEHKPYPCIAMANKLDPVEFQEWMDAANLNQWYAKLILEHNDSELKNKSDEIIQRLSTGYPIHEYAIMKDEAKEIFGEVIQSFDEKQNLKIWKHMSDWLRLYVEHESPIHHIRYIMPGEEEE